MAAGGRSTGPETGGVLGRAPGRVNLIGDHTDYTGGRVLPMAVDRWTEVVGVRTGRRIHLRSDLEPEPAVVDLPGPEATPATGGTTAGAGATGWARYVAAVAAEVRPAVGLVGEVRSTVPPGAGLSSSAALEVAVAVALGADRSDPVALAAACQRAEHRAVGVPCGIMDQLTACAGVAGHALSIDCGTLTVEPVPLPEAVDVVVVHSGVTRRLAGGAYAERRRACEEAETVIGPLREASPGDERAITNPVIRRRARHVLTENRRVLEAVAALRSGDVTAFGRLMTESHRSLRDDFEVSVPALDELVDDLLSRPGVHGARLTGAGFGGCVVAVADRGALDPADLDRGMGAWVVRPVDGACRT